MARASKVTANTEITAVNLVFIFVILRFRTEEVGRMPAVANSNEFKQLRHNPTCFFQFTEPVFFFKDTKFVNRNATKQRAID